MSKKDKNQSNPATQEDLEMWGGNLAFQIAESDTKLEALKEEQVNQRQVLEVVVKQQAKQSRVLGDLLAVNQAILGQLAETKGNGERIENHEERIETLEVKVRILQK